MPTPPARNAHVDEVLPPQTGRGDAANSEVANFLARWLDNWLRIPGTNFKIGLDPILALFPGFGSAVASGGGLVILIEAIRCGASLPVLLRMGGNMLINTLFDFLPVGGPVVSAFFKSNVRNLRLLQSWQAGQHQAIRRSNIRFFIWAGVFFLLLLGMLFGLVAFYVWLFKQMGLIN